MGQKYHQLLKNIEFINVYIFTKRKINYKNLINDKSEIKKIKFHYFIIANETSNHYRTLKWIENNFFNVQILVEKPLFHKYFKYSSNNKVYVGYNLRFNPIVTKIKEILKTVNRIKTVHLNCFSNLHNWNNRNFENSYSFKKSKGGGVELDLSHEIDMLIYLFGKIKHINALNSKKSRFHNTSNDVLLANGTTNKDIYFSLNLDYFSLKNERQIKIIGDQFFIEADFIIKQITLYKNKNKKIFKFKNDPMKNSYKLQLIDFINCKKRNLCNFSEGLYINKIISDFKK